MAERAALQHFVAAKALTGGFVRKRLRGVTVGMLDSESSDRGSSPREASVAQRHITTLRNNRGSVDTLGVESRASRMQTGCDTNTSCSQ